MSDFDTDVLVTDRRRSSQRRNKPERRPVRQVKEVAPEPEEDVRFEDPGISARREIMDRRRQDRRRQIDPTTCERDYSDGEIEFMRAMED